MSPPRGVEVGSRFITPTLLVEVDVDLIASHIPPELPVLTPGSPRGNESSAFQVYNHSSQILNHYPLKMKIHVEVLLFAHLRVC
eukprot:2395236-Amphidinium_carterae.2